MLASRYIDQPLFAGSDAGKQVSHAEAFETVRATLGAASFERASDQLITLARQGKLANPGYALPRPLGWRTSQESEAVASLAFTDSGGMVVQGKGVNAPPLASLQQFCTALFHTILPALIDRPQAMLQWIALGCTALEIERLHGWDGARDYIDRLLHERIPQGKGYVELSQACWQSVQSQHAFRSAGLPGGGGTQPRNGGSGGGGTTQPRNACNQWNWSDSGCTHGAGCKFPHVCVSCGARDHKAKTCPSRGKLPQRKQQHRPALEAADREAENGSVTSASTVASAKRSIKK